MVWPSPRPRLATFLSVALVVTAPGRRSQPCLLTVEAFRTAAAGPGLVLPGPTSSSRGDADPGLRPRSAAAALVGGALPHRPLLPLSLRSSFYEDGFEGEEYSDFADAVRATSSNSSGGTDDATPTNARGGGLDSSDDDLRLLASLRARRDELRGGEAAASAAAASSGDQSDRWRAAPTESGVRLALDDWIRRVAIDPATYPLAAVGSASGSVHVADLGTGEVVCRAAGAHREGDYGMADVNATRREAMGRAMTMLYGEFDGGGIVSIAVRGDWVVSAGRDLGVRVFRLEAAGDDDSDGGKAANMELVEKGRIAELEGFLITGLEFDVDHTLWVGGFDLYGGGGTVRAYELDEEAMTDEQWGEEAEAVHRIDLDSEVLSLSVNDGVGSGVCALANGGVVLFSLLGVDDDDGGPPAAAAMTSTWRPPFQRGSVGGTNPRVYARTAFIFQTDAADDVEDGQQQGASWSVICGGSDGSMYERRLNVVDGHPGGWSSRVVSDKKPFLDNDGRVGGWQMLPSHAGSVVDLESPSEGILLSGGQDGTIRVWDCSSRRRRTEDDQRTDDDNDNDIEDDNENRISRCLFALAGYKVWLGSICTDGKRLVSDGADNTIIVHDFSGEGSG